MSEEGESYLDELLNSMISDSSRSESEVEISDEMADKLADELMKNLPEEEPSGLETDSDTGEEIQDLETNSGAEEVQDLETDSGAEEVQDLETDSDTEELSENEESSIHEGDIALENVAMETEDTSDKKNNITDENGEDLTELLGMLAEHYEEEQETREEITRNIDDSPMGMDEVFQDALSAVSYMENEQEEDSEDHIALEDGKDIDFSEPSQGQENEFSEEGLSGYEHSMPEEGLLDENIADEVMTDETSEEENTKKKSFREKYFDNIVGDKEAEAELASREAEIASEEKKAAAKEEKKKLAAEKKEEKERLKQEKKEKNDLAKAAKAEEKKKRKEEQKRLRLEEEERQIVGRINPVGAAIVCIFFGVIALAVIFGTWIVSYSGSIHNAEIYLDTGDYERAYQAVSGLKVSENDEPTYQKARICAKLNQQIKGCENYLIMGRYPEALDALLKGVKEYDEDAIQAEKLEIKDKQDDLRDKLASKLQEEFQMTLAEARQILQSETREDYSAKVREKAADLTLP